MNIEISLFVFIIIICVGISFFCGMILNNWLFKKELINNLLEKGFYKEGTYKIEGKVFLEKNE